MTGDPDISVVVPFFDAEAHIEACVRSLLAQGPPSIRAEIILVDNNSTDRSPEIARAYERRHPSIRVLAEPRQSSYAARNRGVAAARAPVVAFTDADCVAAPDWLEKVLAALRAPEVQLVQGGRLFATDSFLLALAAAFESERADYRLSAKSGDRAFGYTNNMVVRREVLEREGPFLEKERGADSVLVHRVIRPGSPAAVRYVPAAHVRHLEIRSVRHLLRKKNVYGRHGKRSRALRKGLKGQSSPDLAEMFRRTVRRNRYSGVEAAFLALIVLLELLSYALGRLRANASADGPR